MKIILGSASPRRREILASAGYEFTVDIVNTVEDVEEENPEEYVLKTALKKGEATSLVHPNELVICADTIVACNNHILEKPKDKDDAFRMIKELQNNSHFVYTAVYFGLKGKNELLVEKTKVYIAKMSDQEILDYIATGEPMDKAGAYAIQGKASLYIEKIDGCYFNVVGFPVRLFCKMLQEAGLKVDDIVKI